jgi:hypothetical protein
LVSGGTSVVFPDGELRCIELAALHAQTRWPGLRQQRVRPEWRGQ